MGIVSTVLGFTGFGVGLSAGVVIGYFLFIYFQPCDVKEEKSQNISKRQIVLEIGRVDKVVLFIRGSSLNIQRHKTMRNYAVVKCRVFSQMRDNKIGILTLRTDQTGFN